MDDFPKDPLIGGDGHINGIKAHFYYDYFFIELFSIAWLTLMTFLLNAFHLVNWLLACSSTKVVKIVVEKYLTAYHNFKHFLKIA